MASYYVVKLDFILFYFCELDSWRDVIRLDIQNFDVILGMNWLAVNQTTINCAKKEAFCGPTYDLNFKFKFKGGTSPKG